MNTTNKNDIEISPENPFENCKLGREKIAKSLTKVIKNIDIDSGFIISIDSSWGAGKVHKRFHNFFIKYFIYKKLPL